MQSKNIPLGIQQNPLIKSIWIQQDEDMTDNPPAEAKFIITEDDIDIITEDGLYFMVTEDSPPPPPETFFLLTEVGDDEIVTEDGLDFIITDDSP